MNTSVVPTASGPMHYRHGGNGPPVLLLHGWGGSSRNWVGTMAALQQHCTLYAPDLPGFGASPPMRGPINTARLADAALHFANALGLQQFALVGHSLGAGVATLLAARAPDRVSRLALLSFGLATTPLERSLLGKLHAELQLVVALWRPWLSLWQPWLAASEPFNALRLATPPLPQLLASSYLYRQPDNPAQLQAGVADLARMDTRTAFESGTSIGDPAVEAALGAINAPTLLINGSNDRLFPIGSAQALLRTLPNGRLVLLDNCGHVPMVEQPEGVNRLLGAYLRQ